MVTSAQVLLAVGIGVAGAFVVRFAGRALYVWVTWHLDRLDEDVDALFPADRPREH